MSDLDILAAPDLAPSQRTRAAWEEERRVFLRLLPTLLDSYRGQYVAVHKGSVIASGPDQIDVGKQAYSQVGYVPIYVGLVTDKDPEPVGIPSPRVLPGT